MNSEQRLLEISILYAKEFLLAFRAHDFGDDPAYSSIFLYTGTWTSPRESAEMTCTAFAPTESKRKWILENVETDFAAKIWNHYQFWDTASFPAKVQEIKIESPELLELLTDWYDYLYESGDENDQLLLRDALIQSSKTINENLDKLVNRTDDYIAYVADYQTDKTDGWFNELPMCISSEQLAKINSMFPDDQIERYRESFRQQLGG